MRVKMEDIAKELGVSKSTVSRALNDSPRVNKKTKKEIIALAQKYNYRLHTVASGLAKNLSHTIAVIMPGPPRSISDPFFLEFLNGIGNTAAEYNYSLSLPPIKNKENEISVFDDLIRFNNIDGLILTEPCKDDKRISYLKSKGIPFVFLGRTYEEDQVYSIDGDNIGGAYKATEYLIEKGHQEIACIGGGEELVAAYTRFEGYKNALLDYSLSLDKELLSCGNFTKDGGYKAMKKLLNKNISFTAVFAINDLMAMGAIQALKERGIKIPDQCAIMGFDGIDLGTYIDPKLSTIQQPIYQLGKTAAKTLIKLIKGEKVEEKYQVLPVKMVLRESS